MDVLRSRPFISGLYILFLVCLLCWTLNISPARADVGVQPILPGGSNIKPEDQTPIQMVAESVVMTVRQGTDGDNAAVKLQPGDDGLFPIQVQEPFYPIIYKAVVELNADFAMMNPTGNALDLVVWFPLASTLEDARWEEHIGENAPRVENFQVAVNGKPLEYAVVELPNPQGEDKPLLPWASFQVRFPAGKEINIQVGYLFQPQTGINLLDMTLSYIFQTGAGWAGPIGKAELQINLPYPASEETIGMMPEGGQVDGQQVRWAWNNLEPGPEDDFSILLLRPERWEELQYWRGIVDKFPDFAQGWLRLAMLYERFSQGINEHGHILQYFGETYQKLGVQAAKEAARLDPSTIEPHYELALLYASALEQNPSPDELQLVMDELNIMKELNPEEVQALEPSVYDILYWVLYNEATATAEAASWVEEAEFSEATATAEITIQIADATLTPVSPAPPQELPSITQGVSLVPSSDLQTSSTLTISLIIAVVVLIAAVLYLVIKRK
jgi:hypothetical protein